MFRVEWMELANRSSDLRGSLLALCLCSFLFTACSDSVKPTPVAEGKDSSAASAEQGSQLLVDVTEASGIDFRHSSGSVEIERSPRRSGAGSRSSIWKGTAISTLTSFSRVPCDSPAMSRIGVVVRTSCFGGAATGSSSPSWMQAERMIRAMESVAPWEISMGMVSTISSF